MAAAVNETAQAPAPASAPVAVAAKSPEPVVTPYQVSGSVDYDKLIQQFGSNPITPELVAQIGAVTGCEPHVWLRRGIFFSHREMDQICAHHKAGKTFYLYTGRGPSSESLHFGHLIPFIFTKCVFCCYNTVVRVRVCRSCRRSVVNCLE